MHFAASGGKSSSGCLLSALGFPHYVTHWDIWINYVDADASWPLLWLNEMQWKAASFMVAVIPAEFTFSKAWIHDAKYKIGVSGVLF